MASSFTLDRFSRATGEDVERWLLRAKIAASQLFPVTGTREDLQDKALYLTITGNLDGDAASWYRRQKRQEVPTAKELKRRLTDEFKDRRDIVFKDYTAGFRRLQQLHQDNMDVETYVEEMELAKKMLPEDMERAVADHMIDHLSDETNKKLVRAALRPIGDTWTFDDAADAIVEIIVGVKRSTRNTERQKPRVVTATPWEQLAMKMAEQQAARDRALIEGVVGGIERLTLRPAQRVTMQETNNGGYQEGNPNFNAASRSYFNPNTQPVANGSGNRPNGQFSTYRQDAQNPR